MNAVHCLSPSCMPLAATADGGLVVWTLEQPSILMSAWPGNGLVASGACAEVAYAAADDWFRRRNATARAQFEIEQAIPRGAGVGADAMLGAAVRAALERILPNTPAAADAASLTVAALAADAACARGGLLQIDHAGRVRRRVELAHDDGGAWVLVFATPRDLSDEAMDAEMPSMKALPVAPQGDVDALFRSAGADDIVGFAAALTGVARSDCGQAEQRELSRQLRDIGALASGCTPAGGSAWALVHGGPASRTLRRALNASIGFFGPSVFAAVTNNAGINWRDAAA